MKLLSIPDICARLGKSRWTWHRMVKAGIAPAPVPGLPGHPRWRESDVERFLAPRTYRSTHGPRPIAGDHAQP